MRAGDLKKRFTIERRQNLQGTGDDRNEHWQPLATVWGGIRNVSGTEQNTGTEIMATATHNITIRHFQGLSVTDRFRLAKRVFGIIHIEEDPTLATDMVCVCKEEVP